MVRWRLLEHRLCPCAKLGHILLHTIIPFRNMFAIHHECTLWHVSIIVLKCNHAVASREAGK